MTEANDGNISTLSFFCFSVLKTWRPIVQTIYDTAPSWYDRFCTVGWEKKGEADMCSSSWKAYQDGQDSAIAAVIVITSLRYRLPYPTEDVA